MTGMAVRGMDGERDTVGALGLLFDEDELARRARTTLAAADDGILVIAHGLAPRYRECPVSVRDDDGEALLGSSAGSPVAEAARQRCHAALMLRPVDQHGVGLTLIGRISPVLVGESGDPESNSTGQLSIAFTVERVLASCPRGEPSGSNLSGSNLSGSKLSGSNLSGSNLSGSKQRREISLSSYATAEPDPIAANGHRIARHLTLDHQDQVRALAAQCVGRPVSQIIAAQISQLSRQYLRLWWVDEAGAHPAEVGFPRPAESLIELGNLVREVLRSR